LSVHEVQISDFVDQVQPLLKANWEETGFEFEFNPDLNRYVGLQLAGWLIAIGAFDGDRLVGYSTAVTSPHLFNPNIIFCSTDALFIMPEYRNSYKAAKLIAETERVAKERGAHHIIWHTRSGTQFAGMLERHGYEIDDVCMRRAL
jgi:predicted GNAT superfamily acetyltransferase